MCFAPQRRALFRHPNLQKWSEPLVFLTFWLRNVLRATTACTFSTSQLPKVVRQWCVLYILTWKCASRHNGVQFFISHLASWLRTRRFSEPTFRPSGAPNHWKNAVFCDFTFSRICVFFLLTLLSSNLSLLSASSLLCFSSVHIVGSLTAKLPSKNYHEKSPNTSQKAPEIRVLNFQAMRKRSCTTRRKRSCSARRRICRLRTAAPCDVRRHRRGRAWVASQKGPWSERLVVKTLGKNTRKISKNGDWTSWNMASLEGIGLWTWPLRSRWSFFEEITYDSSTRVTINLGLPLHKNG